jgi:hypothetical protein
MHTVEETHCLVDQRSSLGFLGLNDLELRLHVYTRGYQSISECSISECSFSECSINVCSICLDRVTRTTQRDDFVQDNVDNVCFSIC